jgi:glutamate N-acetyltransferase/amino-acid N-acetyltransferase
MLAMEENFIDGGVCAAKGFTASGIHTGLSKNPSKNDVGIIFCEKKCAAAAVYTQNKVKGSPIIVTQKNIADGYAQAVIVNSTNANTCNADGEEKAQMMCDMTAKELGISPSDVIVASTGVIGQPLNIQPISDNISKLVKSLSSDGSDSCARAIMTTDIKKKEIAVEFEADGKLCRIGGIAKGSGMIHPNMATMLCFITTDTDISPKMLKSVLTEVTKVTFNRVSVDGDTSTNDMACILASGLAGNKTIDCKNDDYDKFKSALYTIMRYLSREIARDGEGATKLLECVCIGAKDERTAEVVAKAVITSSLFKAAMFGADANWGRVLCAIGYADADFDINKVGVTFSSSKGTIEVCRNGAGVPFSEENAKEILLEDEIKIHVTLNEGNAEAVAWGCDLTYDYVKINGDYRS